MSLLEEWSEAKGASPGGDVAVGLDDEEGPPVPLFSLETLERQASHGQGAVTAVAAASNCVLLGTSTSSLIRYDFAEGAATGASAVWPRWRQSWR